MALAKRHIQIGVAAGIVLAAVAWFALSRYASGVAKDELDGFLIRNNLRDVVTYGGVSATPFGTVTVSDVVAGAAQGVGIRIRSLVLSGMQQELGKLVAMEAKAEQVDIPMLELQRGGKLPDSTLLELGYTRLVGDCSLAFRYDSSQRTLESTFSGKFDDLGEVRTQLGLGGIAPDMMGVLGDLPQPTKNPFGLLALLGTLKSVTLSHHMLFLDTGPFHKRAARVTAASTPDEQRATATTVWPVDEDELVIAGMRPSDAKKLCAAGEKWAAEGGAIRIETHLDAPVPLLLPRQGFPSFAFDDAAAYLVATKSTVEFP